MNTVPNNKVSLLELLYVCNDEFKNDVKEIRDKYHLTLDEDDIVPIDEYLDFD